MDDQQIRTMSEFLLKEYEVFSAEYARIHQFRHNMGLTLMAISAAIWAFCFGRQESSGDPIARFALLLPAVLGFASLVWIIRYAQQQTEKSAYMRFITEAWFGAGKGIFEHTAVNEYNIVPPVRRDQWRPTVSFFLGFPFQHVMILTSALLYTLETLRNPFDWREMLLPGALLMAVEAIFLVWYLKNKGETRPFEEFHVQFREAYKGPCPASFRPTAWDIEHRSGKSTGSA